MSTIPLPAQGIDMISDETQLPAGTARAVINADIDRAGNLSRRSGYTIVLPGMGNDFSGIAAFAGRIYVGRGATLCTLDPKTNALSDIAHLGSGLLDFSQYAGSLYVTSRQHIRRISRDGTVHDVGVRAGSLPDMSTHDLGQFTPGRYVVAIGLVAPDGEESQAYMLGGINLERGMRLSNLPVMMGYSWRLYMTAPDGDVLYLTEEFPALMGEHVVNGRPDGMQCQTRNLQPMVPGDFVRGFAGRLFVAREDVLWYSEPMRPHLMAGRSNFIMFQGRIRFFEVLEGGAYVADDEGVHWLAGDDPTKWVKKTASPVLGIRRSSVLVKGHVLPERPTPDECAVWLSAEGYFMGTPSGSVTSLQPGRIRVDPASEGRSVLLTRDGITQVITLTAAPSATVFGVAIDTATIQ